MKKCHTVFHRRIYNGFQVRGSNKFGVTTVELTLRQNAIYKIIQCILHLLIHQTENVTEI